MPKVAYQQKWIQLLAIKCQVRFCSWKSEIFLGYFGQGYQQWKSFHHTWAVLTVGRFKTLQAINIALMLLFFQFCVCLHVKHSIIETIIRSEVLKKKVHEMSAALSALIGMIFASKKNCSKYIHRKCRKVENFASNSIALLFSFFQFHACRHMDTASLRLLLGQKFKKGSYVEGIGRLDFIKHKKAQ